MILENFDMSLGTGLGKMTGTLSGIETGLALAGIPFSKGGAAAALDYLSATPFG